MVGVGAGSSEREHRAFGLPFGSPRDRLALLEDTVRVLPKLLGPGSQRFDGQVLALPETGLYPRPIQDRVPIIVGGSGERVTLRIAAHHADGCNLFGDAETVRRKVAVLREHCASIGRDPAEVGVTHLGTVLAGRDRDEVRERIEQLRPADVGPDRFAERVNAGTIDDHVAGFGRLAEVGVDTAIVSIPDVDRPEALDAIRGVIERFA